MSTISADLKLASNNLFVREFILENQKTYNNLLNIEIIESFGIMYV